MMASETKVALVTGASSGVGRGIALGLARDGWDICVNYNQNKEGAKETADQIQKLGPKSWIYQADVGYKDAVKGMFERIIKEAGRLDLLVNNAGVQTWSSLLELKEEDWDRTIRTNLKGTFLCTQEAALVMKKTGGRIVNIGSGANKGPFPNLVDYSASKGGIDNFTRVSAVELGQYGITVNCVAPGAIEIERTRLEDPDYAGVWGGITPMGRVGYVDDVARAVIFLAQEQSDFISGQTLFVDGGLFAKVPWAYPDEE